MIGDKKRNCSIDVFRYVCSIMIVAIHTSPFSDISEKMGYIFTQILPRIGVPFFFVISGYFYVQKLERGEKAFFDYFKRLLVTYSVWSCMYYIIEYLKTGHTNLTQFIINHIYSFLIEGSYFHFWFFPAILFAVCITTLIFKIGWGKIIIPCSIIMYIIGCLGCSYYKIGIQIPILRDVLTFSQFVIIRRVLLMGFPFFICGYLVFKIEKKVLSIMTNKSIILSILLISGIWLVEIYIVLALKWQTNIIITLCLYLLVVITVLFLLKNPLPQNRNLSILCRVMANFTYYIHPFCTMCISFVANKVFNVNVTETPMFLVTIIMTCLGGVIIYKWNNKIVNYIVY